MVFDFFVSWSLVVFIVFNKLKTAHQIDAMWNKDVSILFSLIVESNENRGKQTLISIFNKLTRKSIAQW